MSLGISLYCHRIVAKHEMSAFRPTRAVSLLMNGAYPLRLKRVFNTATVRKHSASRVCQKAQRGTLAAPLLRHCVFASRYLQERPRAGTASAVLFKLPFVLKRVESSSSFGSRAIELDVKQADSGTSGVKIVNTFQ